MAAPQASSRLELLQARFQQKQLQEKEQKLLQLYDQQQQRAYQVVQRGSAGSNGSNHGSSVSQHTVTRTTSTSHTTSTSQGGKVRQMFDERRQTTVKGIDRSYPLEPLENKPRKQANGLSPQKNGNFTVSRQSVTVKRVARADVNSNLNAGKPMLGYHEEIARDSFAGTPAHHREDKDEFGNENRIAQYANGNYSDDGNQEVRIEEVLDQDTIGRNRMMAKLHLMEFDESMKHRVRNDLESEEFPEDLMVDVPDKLPKRSVTKKLSQAEARLERFKNANAKRSNASRNTTPTTAVAKKRPEPIFPSKSTSRESKAIESKAREATGGQTAAKDVKARREEGSPSPSENAKRTKATTDNAEFYCVESEKSATTYSLKPVDESSARGKPSGKLVDDAKERGNKSSRRSPRQIDGSSEGMIIRAENGSTGSTAGFDRNAASRGDSPEFFCKENERSATTISLKPKPSEGSSRGSPGSGVKNQTGSATSASDRKSIEGNSARNSRRATKGTGSRPGFFRREDDRSAIAASSRPINTKFQSPERLGKIIIEERRDNAQPLSNSGKAASGFDVKSRPAAALLPEYAKEASKKTDASPRFFCVETEKSATTMTVIPETVTRLKRSEERNAKKCNRITSPELRGKGSPENAKNGTRARSVRPQFFCKESERSATTMSIDVKDASPRSPKSTKKFSVSLKDLDSKSPRSRSPQFYCKETERSATTISIDERLPRSPSPEKLSGKRETSPEFYCVESEKSATTISLKPRPTSDSESDRSKSPRSFHRKATKEPSAKSDKKYTSRSSVRRISKSPENSTLSGGRKEVPRRGSGHVLRSIGLIRDVINRQNRNASGNISREKRHSIKSDDVAKIIRKARVDVNRPRTPVRAHGPRAADSSPKSSTSAEVDVEIQEITMSHQYVERDKSAEGKEEARGTGEPVGTTYSRSSSQKSSGTMKHQADSLLTYSVAKPCKKRGSLFESNVFEPVSPRRRERLFSNRRSSSDSRRSTDEGKTVSLRQITRNKSDAGRRSRCSSESPTSNGVFPAEKRRPNDDVVNRGITSEKETPRSQKQTSTPACSGNRESPMNSRMTIFDAPTETRRSGRNSPVRVSSPSSRCKTSKTDGQGILRSTDLVRRVMGETKFHEGKEPRQRGAAGIEEYDTVDGGCPNLLVKGGEKSAPRNKSTTPKKGIPYSKTCSKRHGISGAKVNKPESFLSSKVSVERLEKKATLSGKSSIRGGKDFDEEKHKVVKKDKAVYPSRNVEKLKTISSPDNRYTAAKEIKSTSSKCTISSIDDKLPNIVSVLESEVSSREFKQTGNKRLSSSNGTSNDYIRTDSVESALRRFDSIGAESSHQETRSHIEPSSQNNLELNKESSIEKAISLKALDQTQDTPRVRIRNTPSKTILKKSPALAIKASKMKTIPKISKTQEIRSQKKFARARDSMEIARIIVKSKSPACKRRLFQDSDSGEETVSKGSKSKRVSRPDIATEASKKESTQVESADCSVSVKQLRSIEDIRKSIEGRSSSRVSTSRVSIARSKRSTSKSAVASSVARSFQYRVCSRNASAPEARDLFPKSTIRLSRITKSPSPDPARRKVPETIGRARRSVPSSPSKSPDTVARVQEARSTRRPVAAKVTDPIGNKRTTTVTTKKSTDVVDGVVLENGLHPHDQLAETKCDSASSITRKADAFVIDFDERPPKENETAQPKKPLLRKPSSEKQASPTHPARPVSSVSSVSSGSSSQGPSSGSRSRMATRARTPINGASPSKGVASLKSGNISATENLVACKICGRRFAQDRVSLHEQICAKTKQKKRKQFDATIYRVRGTDLEPFVKKGVAKKQSESKPKDTGVKSNWRRKHEDFINAIRSAKQVQAHLAAGGKLSDLPPPPASDTSDYVQCPHCGRKFNQAAAERHIPKCEHMLHNKPVHSRAPKPKR